MSFNRSNSVPLVFNTRYGDKIVGHLGSSLEFISLLHHLHFAPTIHSFIHSTEEGHICRPSIFIPQHLHLSYECHPHPSFSYNTIRALLGLIYLRASGGLVCGPLSAYVVHFRVSSCLFFFFSYWHRAIGSKCGALKLVSIVSPLSKLGIMRPLFCWIPYLPRRFL